MNKHYLFMDFKRAVRQRYVGQAIFSKTKVCLDSYFWRISKIAPISVFLAIILNGPGCTSGSGRASNVPDAQGLYRKHCVTCHGADGTLGLNGAKDLTQSALPLEERRVQIANGKNMMTPFRDVLSAEEIKAVAEYTMGFKK